MTVTAHSFWAVTFFLNIVRIPAPKAPAWQVMKAHPLPLNQRDIRWPSVLLWDTQYLLSTKFVFTSFKATENNKVVYICVEFKLHQGQPGISINRKSEEFIRIIYLRFDNKWNLKFSTAEQTPLCILHFLHLNLQRHNLPRSCWADKSSQCVASYHPERPSRHWATFTLVPASDLCLNPSYF